MSDGATVTFTDGIRGRSGKLTIYAQSTGESMGRLVAYVDKGSGKEYAGIGSNNDEDNGTEIVICGGGISVTGGRASSATGGDYGAGIGTGDEGDAGEIKILGGDVTAEAEGSGASAIGGGDWGDSEATLASSLMVVGKDGTKKYGNDRFDAIFDWHWVRLMPKDK